MLYGAKEDNVLTALVWSPEACTEIAMRIKPNVFSTRGYRTIAEAAIAYVLKYKKPPGNHCRDELDDKMQGQTAEAKFLILTFTQMEELKDSLNPQYVLDNLQKFIEKQNMINGLEKASDALESNDLAAARKYMRNAMVDASFKHGIRMNVPEEALRFMDKDEDTEFFPSGVAELDRSGVRPHRKTLFLTMAPSNKGKSWWLVEIGKQAAYIYRKNVLHITLEMSEDQVAERYIQAMFSMARGEDVKNLRSTIALTDNNGIYTGFKTTKDRDVLGLRKEVKEQVAKKLKAFSTDKPRVIVKEFPTGSLTVEQLEAYIDLLEQQFDFIPDILILDYPDLMDIDKANLRIDTGRTFIELRGLAVRRNLALAATTQGNRKSATAKTTRESDIGEDWSKVPTCDYLVTYSQNELEEKRGFARLLVEKSRTSKKHYTILITQNYEVGQFCLSSVHMNKDVVEGAKQETDAD